MKFAVPEITKIGVEVPSNRSALVGIITLSGGKTRRGLALTGSEVLVASPGARAWSGSTAVQAGENNGDAVPGRGANHRA